MKSKRTAIFLLIICLILAGCQENGAGVSDRIYTVVPTPANKMKTFTIYSIDSDTMSIVPVSVPKKGNGISAEYILVLVMDNLSENKIATPTVEMKGKKLIVSFEAAGEPVKNCNRKMEHLILECFSNSLLDNLKNYDGIIFRVEGKAYKSENLKFDLNEVYASR